jgi:uncharacterized cupin superfamily protein
MIEERDGWFVVNVQDANWVESSAFGKVCIFENEKSKFPETGVHIFVLEPGKPACRYHRESAQEDFLLLAGRCKLLVNGEEKALKTWDYVHCPPGVTHVFIGDGDGPCAILAIGHRTENPELYYPALEMARRFGAEAPEPTPDPKVAYSDVQRSEPIAAPPWPDLVESNGPTAQGA